MTRFLRVLAVAVLALSGAVGVSGAAGAGPLATGVCDPNSPEYTPGAVCKVEVKTAVVCPGGVPYLGYTVTTEGVAPATVDVVWVNPTGADVTLTGQPLSGSLLWAGATAGVAGQGAAWARPTVEVRFLTTPEASVVVTHPTTTCSAGGASAGGAGTAAGSGVSQARSGGLLSATGLTTAPLLAVAGGLLVIGTAAVLVTRRRHVTQD